MCVFVSTAAHVHVVCLFLDIASVPDDVWCVHLKHWTILNSSHGEKSRNRHMTYLEDPGVLYNHLFLVTVIDRFFTSWVLYLNSILCKTPYM